jgi:hypothetical protein
MVFHVLNRANARARIFAKDADYAAFERVMEETLAKKRMRILGHLIMPNHGVASRATATIAAPGEPAASGGGVGSGANIGRARPSLRQHHLAADGRQATRTRIYLSTSRETKETQLIGLIPFSSAKKRN